jgi:signal transduction histidine kinase/CheY-like chemotaxis protein
VGIENAPPYQVIDEAGREGGVAVDIFKRAAQRAGLKLEWVRCNGGPDLNLTSGAIDLWPVVALLPERQNTLYISKPWLSSPCWLVSLRGKGLNAPDDLAGRVLLHLDDRPSRALAESAFPQSRLVARPDLAGILESVQNGEGDAGLIWGGRAKLVRQQSKNLRDGASLAFMRIPGGKLLSGIGATRVQPDAAEAADALAAEIEAMSRDGEVESLFLANFLDPANEVDLARLERIGRRHDLYAVVTVAILVFGVALVLYQARCLRQAKEKVRLAEKAKSEFLANMSHEIRTPLNSMAGMEELLQGTLLNAQQKEYLGLLSHSTDTLLGLVNDVLDFAKLEAGAMRLTNDTVDVEDLAETAVRAFALRAHQKKLELVLEVAPDCPQAIEGDPVRLRQVLMNLLSNAVKFTEAGEVVVSVSPKQCDEKMCLEFSVADTGIGISASAEKLIFEPFSQADGSSTRKYGGTGLGLVLSRRLLDLMGGRIWYEKRSPRGTVFRFTVPAISAESSSLALPCGGPNRLIGTKILVLDDNAVQRGFVERLLKSEGAVAQCCASAGETLAVMAGAHAASEPFNVLLVDNHVPGQDVLELVSAIKGDARHSECAIIWMLTSDDHETLAKSRALGVEAFVKKPIIRRELLDMVIRAYGKVPGTATAGLTRLQPVDGGLVSKFRLRVLVVEDNTVNLKVMHALLARHGHDVTMAEDGKKALELWQAGAFDLIFMDVQMPGMDGLEATAAIRKQEGRARKHVPIVAMTACAMKEDEERCVQAGMDGYLSKPISARKIAEVLDRLQAEIERRHRKSQETTPPAPPRGL